MKSQCFLLLMCLLSYTVSGQIAEGKMSVGVNLSGDYAKSQHERPYTTPAYKVDTWDWKLVANPFFQYFVKDNLALGIGLTYSIDQTIEDSEPLPVNGYTTMVRHSKHLFGIDILMTKYWFVAPKLALYLQPKLSPIYFMQTHYRRVEDPSSSAKESETILYNGYWRYQAKMSVGLFYFITPKIALQTQMEIAQYTYMKGYQTGGFLKSQPNFMFGLNYVFHE
jgi:hypothetical protein